MFLTLSSFSRTEDPLAYIVYFARTPVEVKDDDEEESEVVVETLEKVDPDWILEHAKRGTVLLKTLSIKKHLLIFCENL